jgi:hypothetical protein
MTTHNTLIDLPCNGDEEPSRFARLRIEVPAGLNHSCHYRSWGA